IDPQGSAARYRFEYLTEAAYLAGGGGFAGAARVPASGDAAVPGAGLAALQHPSGLAPATTYRDPLGATPSAIGNVTRPRQIRPPRPSCPAHAPNRGSRLRARLPLRQRRGCGRGAGIDLQWRLLPGLH